MFTEDDILRWLRSEGDEKAALFENSARIKKQVLGNRVYLRGLVEFSNYCSKDCLYCGIRKSNRNVSRFKLSDEEILSAVRFAYENRYGSVVLQSGEISGRKNTLRISRLLDSIMQMTEGNIRVTLSCGEQDEKTYREWFEKGASRYLLRIETSNPDLYTKLHPNNAQHSFQKRLECLQMLKSAGYQVGTGVMIGLPFQELSDLAHDLLWMQEFGIDMAGMGPYLEHSGTPIYQFRDQLLPKETRFELSLKMIAILRIMMPEINIAASTAMQSIDKMGREKAIQAGANVFMPNITPG